MRITYQNKRLIIEALRGAKKELWRYIELQKKLNTFRFKSIYSEFKFQTIQKDNEKYIFLNIHKVYQSLIYLHELISTKSKYFDQEEIIRDTAWIEKYISEKQWVSVSRWMSNIESSIDTAFNDYMDEIKALPNYQNNQKWRLK